MRDFFLRRYAPNGGGAKAMKTSETPVKSKDFTGVSARRAAPRYPWAARASPTV